MDRPPIRFADAVRAADYHGLHARFLGELRDLWEVMDAHDDDLLDPDDLARLEQLVAHHEWKEGSHRLMALLLGLRPSGQHHRDVPLEYRREFEEFAALEAFGPSGGAPEGCDGGEGAAG